MINMIFFHSGGTTFNVIGEGFVAIDTLTVGIQDSRVRKLIVESLYQFLWKELSVYIR